LLIILVFRDQREGSPKQDSGKSEQDLSEVDLDSPADGTKAESEDSLLNVDVGCDSPTTAKGKSSAQKKAAAAKEADALGKKVKRKSRKDTEIPTPKRSRYSSGRGRNMGNDYRLKVAFFLQKIILHVSLNLILMYSFRTLQ